MYKGKIKQFPGSFTLFKADCKTEEDASVYMKHFNSISFNITWLEVRQIKAFILIYLDMSTVKTFSKGIEEFENWVNICLVGNQIQVTGFQLIHDEDDQVGEKNDYDVDIDEDECEDGGDTKDKTYQEKP